MIGIEHWQEELKAGLPAEPDRLLPWARSQETITLHQAEEQAWNWT